MKICICSNPFFRIDGHEYMHMFQPNANVAADLSLPVRCTFTIVSNLFQIVKLRFYEGSTVLQLHKPPCLHVPASSSLFLALQWVGKAGTTGS
jgi:hypothetical protein